MSTLIAPLVKPNVQNLLLQFQDDLSQQTIAMVQSLVALIGRRDRYTGSHSARVARYARRISTQLRLNDEEVETIAFAAFLHDIGKIAIPDDILLKPDKLSDDELAWIQKCPEWGWLTLRHVGGFQQAARMILHQHERVDGSGYPDGLKGETIPLGSRIITAADSYDALTTDRPYRPSLAHAAALQELERCSGTQFDPNVVSAFRAVLITSQQSAEACRHFGTSDGPVSSETSVSASSPQPEALNR